MNLLKSKIVGATIFICLLIMGFSQLSAASEPFVKKVRIKGNTLIDAQLLQEHFNLGNGLKMNPFIMDLAASELRSVYRFHGHPNVDSYSMLKVKNGTMTLKVDEQKEYRFGAARAELAVYNLDWDFNMKTTEQQKNDAIRKLVKGYKKIKLNEEIVTSYLVRNQRARIEEIQSQKKKAMREKIATAVKGFRDRNIAEAKEETQRIEGMRKRVQVAASKKELETEEPKVMEYGEITPFERSVY
ncbi:MAG: hypothetical protein ACI9UO_000542 [Nitrospinales bacterium]|jgi:hypothetical protein